MTEIEVEMETGVETEIELDGGRDMEIEIVTRILGSSQFQSQSQDSEIPM